MQGICWFSQPKLLFTLFRLNVPKEERYGKNARDDDPQSSHTVGLNE